MTVFEVFSRLTLRGRRHYFRMRASNGKIVAQSEGYANEADAVQTIRSIKISARDAIIIKVPR